MDLAELPLLLGALDMGLAPSPQPGSAESERSPLLRALESDPLRHILELPGDADLPCTRFACRAFRDHSSPALKKCRVDFLRTRVLAVFAWASMLDFVVELPTMLLRAVSVGCVEVLAELVYNRQCPLTAAGACSVAAEKGHLGAPG